MQGSFDVIAFRNLMVIKVPLQQDKGTCDHVLVNISKFLTDILETLFPLKLNTVQTKCLASLSSDASKAYRASLE